MNRLLRGARQLALPASGRPKHRKRSWGGWRPAESEGKGLKRREPLIPLLGARRRVYPQAAMRGSGGGKPGVVLLRHPHTRSRPDS